MTDTNQSSPEALLEAECYCRDGTCHYCRAVDEVKALRRELDKVEAYLEKYAELYRQSIERDKSRTVTREQYKKAVYATWGGFPEAPPQSSLLKFTAQLGLTITDCAEREGECHCREVGLISEEGPPAIVYDCGRSNAPIPACLSKTRCIIKGGGK